MSRLLLLFVLVILPAQLFAGEYSVTPRVIEHTMTPREAIEEEIKVTNTGSVPVRIFPTVNTITLGVDGEITEFLGPVTTDQTIDPSSWVSVSRARIELAPGETKRIPVTIKVNPNAKPGDYFVFVGFAEGDKRDDAESIVKSGRAAGVTVNVTIADMSTEYLRLERFVIDRFVSPGGDGQVTYELANVGDTPITPSGEIILYNLRGEEVGSVPVNPEVQTIAPGATQTFTSPVPNTAAYGRHKAFLQIDYGNKQRASLYDTTFYTVIPIKLLIASFVFLMTVSLILTWLFHRRQQRFAVEDDESVSLHVRSGVTTTVKDHDVNLKSH